MKKVKLNAIIAAAVIGASSMVGGNAFAADNNHEGTKAAVEKTEMAQVEAKATAEEKGEAVKEKAEAVAVKSEMAKEKANAVAEKGKMAKEKAKDGNK